MKIALCGNFCLLIFLNIILFIFFVYSFQFFILWTLKLIIIILANEEYKNTKEKRGGTVGMIPMTELELGTSSNTESYKNPELPPKSILLLKRRSITRKTKRDKFLQIQENYSDIYGNMNYDG